MTLETAKRILLEQGEDSNKEARAVVRGGMTICELTPDGHRTYPWIKVLPTKTDEKSSIEQALEMRRTMKMASNKKMHPQQEPVADSVKTLETVPVLVPKEKSLLEDKAFSIYALISKGKQKLRELMKLLDEIVIE